MKQSINKAKIFDIIEDVSNKNIPIKYVPLIKLDSMCKNDGHQGIVAKISEYKYYKFEDFIKEIHKEKQNPLILMLDEIQDPQNLGTILRTSEAMGVDGIIIPQRRSVGITNVVWKASMGALAHLKICRTNNISRIIDSLKDKGYKIFGTDVKEGKYIDADKINSPIVLVVGNEAKGVNRAILEKCDYKIKIDMHGKINSLNVAIATSILLYEISKSRVVS